MKIKVINPEWKEYWASYDAYAPIGVHIGMKDMSPCKFVEITLKDFLKMILENIKGEKA